MYFFLIGIVLLAFVFNILIITKSSYPGGEVGVGPIIQLVLAVPLFVIAALVFYFTKNMETNTRTLVILLPMILQIAYFAFTKDLFSFFKQDTGGFLIRSYLYSIAGSTALGTLIAWVFGVLKK